MRWLLVALLLAGCGAADAEPFDPTGSWDGVLQVNGVDDSTLTLELEATTGAWRFVDAVGEGRADVTRATTRRLVLRLTGTSGCSADLELDVLLVSATAGSGTMFGQTCERRHDGDVIIRRRDAP